MERGSDKHSPEVDDQMKQEAEPLERGRPQDTRADEGRLNEGPVEKEDDLDDEPGAGEADAEAPGTEAGE